MSIEDLRREIDSIDGRIIKLLAERIQIAGRIGQEKKAQGQGVSDTAREKQVLEHVREIARQEHISPEYAARIYRIIIEAGRKEQLKTSG